MVSDSGEALFVNHRATDYHCAKVMIDGLLAFVLDDYWAIIMDPCDGVY